ncbi:MAG: autoinducer synthase [Sphingomonas sp. 66-10]|nr:MAG: autoinducer synthase [Sphingomonas sp. 66-10]
MHMKSAVAALGDEALRQMFIARREVFVDLLGWDVPVLEGRYEIDQFDDEHAAYLIVSGPNAEHLASARLLPTTRPHILADLFAHLCEGEIPRGPGIFEITRFCLDRRLTAAERRDARNKLVSSIAEYGIANGIHTFTGVAEMGWLRQILGFGWRSRPLGRAQRVGGKMLAALAIDIDRETPALLARTGIYSTPRQAEGTRHAA